MSCLRQQSDFLDVGHCHEWLLLRQLRAGRHAGYPTGEANFPDRDGGRLSGHPAGDRAASSCY